MEVRRYERADYSEISSWCEKRNFPAYHPEILSDCGFFVPGLAVCFLYTTNSKLGIVEFLMSNPTANKKETMQAIELIVKSILEESKKLGMIELVAVTDRPGFARKFKGYHAAHPRWLIWKEL